MMKLTDVRAAGILALAVVVVAGVRAQQTSQPSQSPTLKTGITYSDQYSADCEKNQQPNIWKQLGVNPLTCHPQSMGVQSNGQCFPLQGATVVAQQNGTCYYCVPQVPPGTLYIPIDQVQNASVQGYTCGESPTDPGCMSVCSPEFSNTGPYVPPGATTLQGGAQQSPGPGGGQPGPVQGGIQGGPTPGPAGGIGYVPGPNPCQPTPGYNYCNNGPGARLPAGCVCPGMKTSTSSENTPCQPAKPDMPSAAPYLRYTLGFEAGFAGCLVSPTVVDDVAAAAFGSDYAVVPSLLQINATAQTMQSVIGPTGASSNADPYLEGQTGGGKLCSWLLANDSGKVGECPEAQPAPATPQLIASSAGGSSGSSGQSSQDDCFYPQCLYTTECYQKRQTLHLNVDEIAEKRTTAYNCYMYAKAFITGAFPSILENNANTIDSSWLQSHGFVKQSSSKKLTGLAPVKAGDLVFVEDPTAISGYSHVGVVIGVDQSGNITRIRQKIGYDPGPDQCVKDTTAEQFENTVEPLKGDEQYELWTNNSQGFFTGRIAP